MSTVYKVSRTPPTKTCEVIHMAPTAVYEGDVTRSEPGAGGQLFIGQKLWFSQSVPQRKWLMQNAENNGAIIVPLEKQADILLVDHARKNQAPGTFSYKYVELSIRNGQLEDLQHHSVGSTTRVDRPVGSVRTAGKNTRNKFTDAEDQLLWDWVKPYAALGGSWKGNEIYKQLEAFNNNHTFQSWRDRWIKHTQFQQARRISRRVGPAYETDDEADYTAVHNLLRPTSNSAAMERENARDTRPLAKSHTNAITHAENQTPEVETDKSSQQITPPGSGRNAIKGQLRSPGSAPVLTNDDPVPIAECVAGASGTPAEEIESPMAPQSVDGTQESDTDQELPWSSRSPTPTNDDPLPLGYNFDQDAARALYKAVPWIVNVKPECSDDSWSDLAKGRELFVHKDVWRSFFYDIILPEYRRRNHLYDDEAFENHKTEMLDRYITEKAHHRAAREDAENSAEDSLANLAEDAVEDAEATVTQAQAGITTALYRADGNATDQVLDLELSRQVDQLDRIHHTNSTQDERATSCANCFTSETRRWRKDLSGRRLCDECGRFLKANGVMRPSATRTESLDDNHSQESELLVKTPNTEAFHDDDEIRMIALAGIKALERFSGSAIEPMQPDRTYPQGFVQRQVGLNVDGALTPQPHDLPRQPTLSQLPSPDNVPTVTHTPKRGGDRHSRSDRAAKRLKRNTEYISIMQPTKVKAETPTPHHTGEEDVLGKARQYARNSSDSTGRSSTSPPKKPITQASRMSSDSPLFLPESMDQSDEEASHTTGQDIGIVDQERQQRNERKPSSSPPLQLVNEEESDIDAEGSSQYAPSETPSEGNLFTDTQPELSQAWETAPQQISGGLSGQRAHDDDSKMRKTGLQRTREVSADNTSEDLRWETGPEYQNLPDGGIPGQARKVARSNLPADRDSSDGGSIDNFGRLLPEPYADMSRTKSPGGISPSWHLTDGEDDFASSPLQSGANGSNHHTASNSRSALNEVPEKSHLQTIAANNRIDTQALLQQSMPGLDTDDSFMIPPPEGGWDLDSDVEVTHETVDRQSQDGHYIKHETTQFRIRSRRPDHRSTDTMQEASDSTEIDEYFASQSKLYSRLSIDKPTLQNIQVRALESTNLDTHLATHLVTLMIKSYQARKHASPSFDLLKDPNPSHKGDKKAIRARKKNHVRAIVDTLIPHDIRGVWTTQDDAWLLGEDARRVRSLETKHGGEGINVRFEYLSAALDE